MNLREEYLSKIKENMPEEDIAELLKDIFDEIEKQVGEIREDLEIDDIRNIHLIANAAEKIAQLESDLY